MAPLISMGVFLATTAVVLVLLWWGERDDRRISARVQGLSDRRAPAGRARCGLFGVLQRMGELIAIDRGLSSARLRERLHRAGIYSAAAAPIYRGAQGVLMLGLPCLLGLLPWTLGWLARWPSLLGVLVGLGGGLILPGLWLDRRQARRQRQLRRAWPDALDMMVMCLEGGLSLQGTLQRVTEEMEIAHPDLAYEMNVMDREIQLGRSAGEGLANLGRRTDIEEIRDLSLVLTQAERYGASISRGIRIHADACREERQQQAEERAQKASVKILFPTLLCIFPAIFIVILGPAAFQLAEIFSGNK